MIVSGGRIAVGWKVYPLVTEEFFVSRGVLVGSDPEDDAVSRLDVFLQPIEGGSLFHARWAPSRPKIQYHYFTLQIGQMSRPPCDFQREVLRRLAGNRGLALAVTRHRKEQDYAQHSRQHAPSRNFSDDSHRMLY